MFDTKLLIDDRDLDASDAGVFERHNPVSGELATRAAAKNLSPRAARHFVLAANDVKLHEVRCAANKQRRPRHNSHDVAALDELLFKQTFFRDQDKLFDALHFGDRSRRRDRSGQRRRRRSRREDQRRHPVRLWRNK